MGSPFSYAVDSVLPDKVNCSICMPGGREELFNHVFCAQFQTARAHAGVAAEILVLEDVLIDQERDMVLFVIHESHDTDGARFDVQILQHGVFPGKRETGGIDLRGEFLRLELFVTGHHEKIEFRLLTITEKEVFADQHAEYGVDLVAGFHVVGAFVIGALIGDLQVVQKIIGSYFPRETPFGILRSSVE